MKGEILSMTLLAASATASFNCKFDLDGQKYDLTQLKGIHKAFSSQSTPPSIRNSTWYVNPCGHLDSKKLPEGVECPSGTQICGVEEITLPDEKNPLVASIIPVAGDLDGNQSGSKTTKLEKKDGVKVEYRGGKWGDSEELGAEIEFVCSDKSNKDKDDDIKFVDWDGKVLKLEWATKEVCKRDGDGGKGKDGDKDEDKDGDKNKDDDKKNKDEDKNKDEKEPESNSWGFFTWLFFIGILLVGVYVVASAWINHNRYGLTGVDLLPHSESVRDLPYLVRDFIRKAIGTFSGSSGNRGGYSAV